MKPSDPDAWGDVVVCARATLVEAANTVNEQSNFVFIRVSCFSSFARIAVLAEGKTIPE
jgi:hypothetical protein